MSTKVIHTKETERKFLVKHIQKKKDWDRELRIVQWYPESGNNKGEKKYKLIFDLLNNTVRFVSVIKFRRNALEAEKKVEYFTEDEFDIHVFLMCPFVIKLRSICANIHLDYFVQGKKAGSYLLELEQDVMDVPQLSDLKIKTGQEVTHDKNFRNKNMCILFTEKHTKDLISTLKNFKFI